jgi:type II secretory pathway pseudopilin PulG
MKRNKSGFSMIEVLVASTIMIMIVMMLGMLFQQTSQAWQTGKQRANAYQQVRAFFGAIQHDASAAINTNTIPRLFTGAAPVPRNPQMFSDPLKFYTLTGTGFEGGIARRSIMYVEYNGSTRTVTTYTPKATGGYTAGSQQTTQFANSDPNGATIRVGSINAFALDTAGKPVTFQPGTHPFPAYITVNAGVDSQAVKSYNVGAASGGPDRTMGGSADDVRGRDDIKTWAD